MNKTQRDIRRKKRVFEHAARNGNVRKACRYFGIARSGFYVWKKAYETQVWGRIPATTTKSAILPPSVSAAGPAAAGSRPDDRAAGQGAAG